MIRVQDGVELDEIRARCCDLIADGVPDGAVVGSKEEEDGYVETGCSGGVVDVVEADSGAQRHQDPAGSEERVSEDPFDRQRAARSELDDLAKVGGRGLEEEPSYHGTLLFEGMVSVRPPMLNVW